MQIVDPDLIADMRDLPLAVTAAVTAVGLGLYVTGWATHRFWIGLTATFAAGLAGLRFGLEFGVQPVIAGVVMAIAAGCVALSLARIALFVIYGFVCWYLIKHYAAAFESPLLCFLVGGLFSVLFHRLCVILLSSAVGLLLLLYGGLVLLERLLHFDAVAWLSDTPEKTITLGYWLAVFAGILVQSVAERAWNALQQRRKQWLDFRKKLAAGSAKSSPLSWLPFLRKAA